MWQTLLIKIVMALIPLIESEAHVLIVELINKLQKKAEAAPAVPVVPTTPEAPK